jgi:O-antigen/teichoic acid export membrane protein
MKSAASAETMSALVRGGAMTLGGSLVGRLASVAQSVVIARGLDPHRLGVFAILNYVLGLGGAIVDLGVPVATAKLVAEARVARPTTLRRLLAILAGLSVVLATAGAVALLGGADALSRFYREPALAPLFRLAAALLFVALLGAFLASAAQGFQRIDTLAAVTVVKAVVALGATLVLLPSFGLVGVVVASIVAEAIAWPLVGRSVHQALAATPVIAADAVAAGPIVARTLALSVPVVLNGLAVWGGAWFVRSYLARKAGYEAVGYFHVADACARLLLLMPSALAVPFLPAISASVALGREATSRMVEGGLRLTLLAVAPAGAFLCLAAEPVLTLIYGDVYAAAAASLTAALVLAAGFQALAVMVWSTLVGAGRTWAGFAVQGAGQLALVTLTAVLVPAHGLTGVAVAAMVASVATAALGLTLVCGGLGVRFAAVRSALTVAVLGWVMAAALWTTGATGWLEAVALATAVVLLQFHQLTPDERRWVIDRVRRPAAEAAR